MPNSKIKKAAEKEYIWSLKKRDLESQGKLIVKRECEWFRELASMETKPETEMARILEKDDEESLLEAIQAGKIYGFAVCDVESSDAFVEQYKDFLFPPVIKHETITNDHVTGYMQRRVAEEERKLDFKTVVQVYNGQQLFLMTDIVKFYLDIGIKVSNITQFVQYIPSKILKPFVQEVVGMRIDATRQGDDTKQMTAKIFGNSCKYSILNARIKLFVAYGKCAEDVTRYRNTIVTADFDRYRKYKRMARCLNETELISADDEFCAYEVSMKKSKVTDSKPVHLGVAILQHSKLLFLR